MNKHEIRTIRQEAQRFSKDAEIEEAVEGAYKIILPFEKSDKSLVYFFIAKRKGCRKFSLLVPVESTGLIAVQGTLSRLQPLLGTYGLMLSSESVIMEETHLPLHKRINHMAQALITIDGIRRLWQIEYRSQNGTQNKDTESTGNTPNNSTSR